MGMDGTFVYRLVKDKFFGISIWQLWMKDNCFYFVGKGAVAPSATTVESLKFRYDKILDAFNHPVIEIKDIKEMADS